VCIKCER